MRWFWVVPFLIATGAASAAAYPDVRVSHGVHHARVCAAATQPLTTACHARVVTDGAGTPFVNNAGPVHLGSATANVAKPAVVSGFAPADLRSAYNVPWDGKTAPSTASPVIAIVDAYGYKNAERDLGVYRKQFGLPLCTTANGCFKKVNQTGGTSLPAQNLGWAQETALDLQMVSAICPSCRILLVEASSASFSSLATAENTAASKALLGKTLAHAISNSYGGGEKGSSAYAKAYNHPGVAITVSSGDSGYGVEFPASSNTVIAVGGTSLVKDGSARGWSETAWSDAGSGCSTLYAAPAWQTANPCGTLASGAAARAEADTSAVADPSTGVAVYAPRTTTASTWYIFGGTSVAAPLVAGIYGVNYAASGKTDQPQYYGAELYAGATAAPALVNDVTAGSNGSCGGSTICTAAPGYDGPTGIGTPAGALAY